MARRRAKGGPAAEVAPMAPPGIPFAGGEVLQACGRCHECGSRLERDEHDRQRCAECSQLRLYRSHGVPEPPRPQVEPRDVEFIDPLEWLSPCPTAADLVGQATARARDAGELYRRYMRQRHVMRRLAALAHEMDPSVQPVRVERLRQGRPSWRDDGGLANRPRRRRRPAPAEPAGLLDAAVAPGPVSVAIGTLPPGDQVYRYEAMLVRVAGKPDARGRVLVKYVNEHGWALDMRLPGDALVVPTAEPFPGPRPPTADAADDLPDVADRDAWIGAAADVELLAMRDRVQRSVARAYVDQRTQRGPGPSAEARAFVTSMDAEICRRMGLDDGGRALFAMRTRIEKDLGGTGAPAIGTQDLVAIALEWKPGEHANLGTRELKATRSALDRAATAEQDPDRRKRLLQLVSDVASALDRRKTRRPATATAPGPVPAGVPEASAAAPGPRACGDARCIRECAPVCLHHPDHEAWSAETFARDAAGHPAPHTFWSPVDPASGPACWRVIEVLSPRRAKNLGLAAGKTWVATEFVRDAAGRLQTVLEPGPRAGRPPCSYLELAEFADLRPVESPSGRDVVRRLPVVGEVVVDRPADLAGAAAFRVRETSVARMTVERWKGESLIVETIAREPMYIGTEDDFQPKRVLDQRRWASELRRSATAALTRVADLPEAQRTPERWARACELHDACLALSELWQAGRVPEALAPCKARSKVEAALGHPLLWGDESPRRPPHPELRQAVQAWRAAHPDDAAGRRRTLDQAQAHAQRAANDERCKGCAAFSSRYCTETCFAIEGD